MKLHRQYYFFLIAAVIFLGIFSRKTSLVPLCIGDLLYAVMMYILLRILFFNKKGFFILIISLFTCYTIEFLQLYQAEWMIALRKTLFGRYVLGQGFLWTDIIAYTFGSAIAFIVEKMTLNFNQKSA